MYQLSFFELASREAVAEGIVKPVYCVHCVNGSALAHGSPDTGLE